MLQLVAFAVALAAALLLIIRSPFGLVVVALLLASRFALFEYSVMARNYGISMLLLFLLAIFYERYRARGPWLGSLLFLLANCNVHSALLAGSFLVFWFFDILGGAAEARPRALRTFFLNAAIATLGVALCAATVYPTFNDAAQIDRPEGVTAMLLGVAAFLPAASFSDLLMLSMAHYASVVLLPMSMLLLGSTLGLIQRPAALLAALVALIGFSFFSALIYPSDYRHQALWLVFLTSLYWIAGRRDGQERSRLSSAPTARTRAIATVGYALFAVLLVVQVGAAFSKVIPIAFNIAPESRSRDLGLLVARSPQLKEAIMVGDPDYLVESLPYLYFESHLSFARAPIRRDRQIHAQCPAAIEPRGCAR